MTNNNELDRTAKANVLTQREKQEEFVVKVAKRVSDMAENGQIDLPENYSATNALQAAFFKLTEVDFGSKVALIDKVTVESVAFALQDMAIQGLSVAKNQGYFIPYGDKLQFQRSYHGTKAIIKRLNGVKDIWAEVVWQGEELEISFENGRKVLKDHKVNWLAQTGKKEDILGAYAIIETESGEKHLEIMTMAEILTAWSTSKNTSVQNKYPQEMAKRTVINRAAKHFINTSDDSDVLIAAINRTTENEYDNEREIKDITSSVKEEIKDNANKELLDIPDNVNVETGEIVEPKEEVQQPQQQVIIEDDLQF